MLIRAIVITVLVMTAHAGGAQLTAVLSCHVAATTTLHEPVLFVFSLENRSGESIAADFGMDDKTKFVFRHTRPDGTVITARPGTPSNGISFVTVHTVAPNRRWASQLTLDEWLDFSQVGTHHVEITFDGVIAALDGHPVVLQADGSVVLNGQPVSVQRTGSFAVEVLPRDEAVLRSRCEGWLSAATNAAAPQFQSQAQAALAHVIDPIAIPYLARAIEKGNMDFAPLARIGGPEAEAALLQLAQSRDEKVAAVAKSFLAFKHANVLSYDVPTHVTLHEPIVAQMTLHNELNEPVHVDFGSNAVEFITFGLVDPHGVKATVTPKEPGDLSPVWRDDVEAFRTVTHTIVLSRWLDFSEAGTYQLMMDFSGSVRATSASAVPTNRSASFRITVLPRDEAALTATCRNLLIEALSLAPLTYLDAIDALTTVRDPIAIPALVEVTEHDRRVSQTIEAIRLIGGVAAKQALQRLSASPNVQVAAMALHALDQIR